MRIWRTFAGVCWTGKRFDFDGGAQEVLGRGRNPPVTALPCQPPLGKGPKGTGVRIATAVNWSLVRNDTVFCKGCNGRATARVAPTEALQGARWGGRLRGSPLRKRNMECGGAGRCGERTERCQWQEKRGERVAAVKISSVRRKAAQKFWAPQQGHRPLRSAESLLF